MLIIGWYHAERIWESKTYCYLVAAKSLVEELHGSSRTSSIYVVSNQLIGAYVACTILRTPHPHIHPQNCLFLVYTLL